MECNNNERCFCFDYSLRVQPARSEVPFQHGAVQIIGPSVRWRVFEVPPLHRRQALSLLQGRILSGPHQANHTPSCMQTWVTSTFFLLVLWYILVLSWSAYLYSSKFKKVIALNSFSLTAQQNIFASIHFIYYNLQLRMYLLSCKAYNPYVGSKSLLCVLHFITYNSFHFSSKQAILAKQNKAKLAH